MNRRRNDKSKRFDASEVVARKNVHLIIDGYNLMHVTRFKPINREAGELRRCREGLLSLLAEQLPAKRYRDITVVFDSEDAPKHLPDQQRWSHLNVLFARDENSADDMIANLVKSHNHARNLVVVSSDHRVQVAAQRRKAISLDADSWFDAVLDFRPPAETTEENKPPELTSEQLSDFIAEMHRPKRAPGESVDSTSVDEAVIENPFPPGYFDDLDGVE